eukprot:COSAG02_NODE_4138_length_5725_cov_20.138287_4_plen_37_part_00
MPRSYLLPQFFNFHRERQTVLHALVLVVLKHDFGFI